MNKNSSIARHLFTVFIVWMSSQAFALDNININGFASVGGGWFNGENRDSSYDGYDRDFQGDPATKFGLQFSTQINDQVSATGQLLAKGSNDYNVESEWAYLTYAANDNWDIRVGRLRSPFYPYSDFLDVGYAYPWITPPNEVYRFIFTTVEGMDTLYRSSFGEWDSTFQMYYGRLTDETILAGEEVDLDLVNFTGANISLNRDWLTLRASYNYAKFSSGNPTALEGLLSGLRAAGAGPAAAADALEVKDEIGRFYGVAALIDYEDWLMTAEYTILDVKEQSIVSEDVAWYLMLGKRVDEFTFHVTYMKQEDDPDFSILDTIPDGAAPALDAAKAAALDLIGKADNSGVTLGMRYDFSVATAFKVEVTEMDIKARDEKGTLINFSLDTVF